MVNPSQLIIQLGPLDPAFKGTPQQFATHMVERLRIVSPSGITSFVVGDTEPLYNAGPWLKGGTAWWVWDETQKKYIPLDITDTALATVVINLLAQLANLIDANGALKDGTVWKTSVLADRVVTQPKLHWNSVFYGTATGPDTYDLALKNSDGSSPIPPTLGDGVNSSFAVFAIIQGTNTAAVPTLRINGGTAYPIIKGAATPLLAGDLIDGRVYLLVFDGTSFQIVGDIVEPTAITAPTVTFSLQTSSGGADPGLPRVDGAWTKRSLTDTAPVSSPSFVLSFSGSLFELDVGTYEVSANMPISQSYGRLRIYDHTNGVSLVQGINGGSGNNISGPLILFGRFTLTAPAKCELDYYTVNAGGGGLGVPISSGENEIYAVVKLMKIS